MIVFNWNQAIMNGLMVVRYDFVGQRNGLRNTVFINFKK